MPALSFMARMAPLVESGAKPHTIRDKRKRPIKEGDLLYLYTGMRTNHCRKLGEGLCVRVVPILISAQSRTVKLGEEWLDGPAIALLAKRDGFESVEEFFDYFKTEVERDLIEWELHKHQETADGNS